MLINCFIPFEKGEETLYSPEFIFPVIDLIVYFYLSISSEIVPEFKDKCHVLASKLGRRGAY